MPNETTTTTPPATNNTPAAASEVASTPAATPAPVAPVAPATPAPEAKPSSLLEGAKAEPTAPEKYEFKMPEGVSPDTKVLEGFEPLAKEMGLSQENAQKLVDLYAKHVTDSQQAQIDALATQRKEWVAEVQKDPKHQEMLATAKRGLLAVASLEAQKLFSETWLGDHPLILATFAKVGALMKEHPVHLGNQTPQPEKKSAEDVLYPGYPKK